MIATTPPGPATADDDEGYYAPCRNGLHIGAPDPSETFPVTLANFHGVDAAAFARLMEAHAYAPRIGGSDLELFVDLMRDGDIVDTFAMRRQSLDVVCRALTEPSRSPAP